MEGSLDAEETQTTVPLKPTKIIFIGLAIIVGMVLLGVAVGHAWGSREGIMYYNKAVEACKCVCPGNSVFNYSF